MKQKNNNKNSFSRFYILYGLAVFFVLILVIWIYLYLNGGNRQAILTHGQDNSLPSSGTACQWDGILFPHGYCSGSSLCVNGNWVSTLYENYCAKNGWNYCISDGFKAEISTANSNGRCCGGKIDGGFCSSQSNINSSGKPCAYNNVDYPHGYCSGYSLCVDGNWNYPLYENYCAKNDWKYCISDGFEAAVGEEEGLCCSQNVDNNICQKIKLQLTPTLGPTVTDTPKPTASLTPTPAPLQNNSDCGEKINSRIAGINGESHLSNGTDECVKPGKIIIHWSAAFNNWAATKGTLQKRDMRTQIATDGNKGGNQILLQNFFLDKVEKAKITGDPEVTKDTINNEISGLCFDEILKGLKVMPYIPSYKVIEPKTGNIISLNLTQMCNFNATYPEATEIKFVISTNGNNSYKTLSLSDYHDELEISTQKALTSTCSLMKLYPQITLEHVKGHIEITKGKSDPGKNYINVFRNKWLPKHLDTCDYSDFKLLP